MPLGISIPVSSANSFIVEKTSLSFVSSSIDFATVSGNLNGLAVDTTIVFFLSPYSYLYFVYTFEATAVWGSIR